MDKKVRINIRTTVHRSTTMYLHFTYANIEMTVVSLEPAGGETDVQFESQNFETLRSPKIDSKEPIPPGCVAWRTGTITLFLFGS